MKTFTLSHPVCITALILISFTCWAEDTAQLKTVDIETTHGTISLELFREEAPLTTDNFLRYVREDFYDGTIFHRVITDFMIQGGGFTKEMSRKDTHRPIRNEASNGIRNKRGTIAMARTRDPHSATAQFFINHADNDFLNHKDKSSAGWGYTVFGKVKAGMEIVDRIADSNTTSSNGMADVPIQPVIILTISEPSP